MSIKVCCPVCGGKGKVDSDFGGGCPNGSKKSCPACCGTGMQEVSDYVYRRCPDRWINPCPQPYIYPWYAAPTVTWSSQCSPATGSTVNFGSNQMSYTFQTL